ncbi:MAG: DUF294 nucleotidyltransferase-like domain-containing protein [Bacilli bacterium]
MSTEHSEHLAGVVAEMTQRGSQEITLSDLRFWRSRLAGYAARQLRHASVAEVFADLGRFHRAVHRRVFELAALRLQDEGWPDHGAARLFLLLGSGARDEQSIKSDQDHALILIPPEGLSDSGELTAYGRALGELTAAMLAEAGYPLCAGNVMASNPRWRGTIAEWNTRLNSYGEHPDWSNIRYLLIASDAMAVAGDSETARQIRALAVGHVKRSSFIRWKIADQVSADRLALPFAAHFVELGAARKASFSLKDGLYTPLVNIVRVWAHSIGSLQLSTFARIDELETADIWSSGMSVLAREALATALEWRLRLHIQQSQAGQAPDDELPLADVREADRERLQSAVRTVRQLQHMSSKHFARAR